MDKSHLLPNNPARHLVPALHLCTERCGYLRNYEQNIKHLQYLFLNLRKLPGTEEAVQETNNRPAAGEAPQPGKRPQQIRRAQCGFRQGKMILLHPSQRA
jgi:hypothetical protein